MNENIMSEERYKQIKDSIELQSLVKSQTGVEDELLQEEIELLNAYEKLKEKLDEYENPKDMTLFAMWCTEKVKEENKALLTLINWAVECDFGFDNFANDEYVNWEEFEKESNDMNYIESMIYYAEKYNKMHELEQGSDSDE